MPSRTPGSPRRVVARTFVGAYRLRRRGGAKLFSLLSAGAFHSFGSHSVIEPPVRLNGERWIAVGRDVYVGAGCWLQVIGTPQESPAVVLGDGTSIAGGCVISAARSIVLGRRVLIARNVYLADHSHAFEDTTTAVMDQGIDRLLPIAVGDGAWLGENVVVGPGVTIGRGAVVGANSVVLADVPDFAVAVGAPARIVRSLAVRSAA
jgi:acetyltransferase-like isoleucine patch superfamily enzyme